MMPGEMKYKEIVKAMGRNFDLKMICGNGMVKIFAGKTPERMQAVGLDSILVQIC